jgi:hypothetical protein
MLVADLDSCDGMPPVVVERPEPPFRQLAIVGIGGRRDVDLGDLRMSVGDLRDGLAGVEYEIHRLLHVGVERIDDEGLLHPLGTHRTQNEEGVRRNSRRIVSIIDKIPIPGLKP